MSIGVWTSERAELAVSLPASSIKTKVFSVFRSPIFHKLYKLHPAGRKYSSPQRT